MWILNLQPDFLTISVEDSVLDCRTMSICRLILIQFHIDFNLSRLRIRHDMNTPVFDMHGMGLCQPYMTIDATSAIPAGVRLVGIVDLHRNDIITLLQEFSNIVLKT